MRVAIDDRTMRRFVAQMPRAGERAVSRGLNKAIKSAWTFGGREVAQARNLKVGRAKADMTIRRSSPAKPEASIFARGTPIPVMEVKGAKTQTKRGVTAKISKGGRHLFKGAFIATMASGHTGVFMRVGSKVEATRGKYKGRMRQRIVEQVLPSVAATMVQEGTEARMRAHAVPIYEAELVRWLDLEMKRAGAR